MAADDSLDQSINNAQRHYSSLFLLPSFKKALVALAAICIVAGLSSAIFSHSIEALIIGVFLGIVLFAVNFTVDLLLSKVALKGPIFVLRRVTVLSLFSWVFWLIFLIIGVAFGEIFSALWWVKLCLLGFATLLTFRTVVFFSVSSATFERRLIAILLQPIACIVPFAIFWASQNVALVDYLPFLVISPFAAMLFAYFFVHSLDRIGLKKYGVASIDIFKTFMLNWVASLNAPLEGFLEKMGQDADIEVSLLKFDTERPKAAIIVPLVHPGPFKNIGSSLLPSLLKNEYEKEYNCDACVALGLLGHELDAASQTQNHKIIKTVLNAAKIPASFDQATPFVRVSEDFVAASCQIFGKTAFLSFTLAPKTTEDLPQELGKMVREEAKKLGLEVIVVNAHNSLTNTIKIEASIETLGDVAIECLKKAVSQESFAFQIGAATIHPPEFSLRDGMGDGGITAIIVKVAEQKTAYIVIDGNNMVTGLREKILDAVTSAGFQESEVFTTDTHAVSAVVVGHRGYHPIGEAIQHEALINCIKDTAVAAESKLENCKAGCQSLIVPKVRVIGNEFLASITDLVDSTIQKAKQIMVPIFAAEGLLLVLLLAIL